MYKYIFLCLFFSSVSVATYEQADKFLTDKSETKVLIFLSEKCPCSRSHIEHLNQLVSEYKDVGFYGVISEPAKNKEQQDLVKGYFNSKNFQFPLIADSEQSLVKKYKALKTPHVTLINKGKILYQGGLTSKKSFKDSAKKYLSENLVSLKKGEPLKYKNGVSLGCYIRRAK